MARCSIALCYRKLPLDRDQRVALGTPAGVIEPAGPLARPTGMRQTPILIAAFLSLLASAAVAQPDREAAKVKDFGQRMFATKSFAKKTTACFVRTYDAAHLARHPKQTVSAMKMLIAGEKLEGATAFSYSYKLGVNFRDRKGDYASSYDCGYAEVSDAKLGAEVSCHDGCEAGGIAIALAPNSKAIIVKLESVAVWLADKPQDESAQFEFKGGADDRVFRLERVDMENCKSLIKVGDEVAALQPE